MSIAIAFSASKRPEAQEALAVLKKRYGSVSEDSAEVIVALGGDGAMLDALRRRFSDHLPVYGMNRGTVGFLMNEYLVDDLPARIDAAERAHLSPLQMFATDIYGETHRAVAINEVSMLRQTSQTAHLQITVDGQLRMPELSCDGVMVATPAGSTAYNLSAHGPILPIGANLLALTPVSAFRPRRWKGALLRHDAKVDITVTAPKLRPVSASADNLEVRNIAQVSICAERTKALTFCSTLGHRTGRAYPERTLLILTLQ
ncbi:UNVERIFIED_CONTAM: hypothetical protein GTU68_008927 [Idotea baltica]|nr:hypothetical protein [Idotea baltica]